MNFIKNCLRKIVHWIAYPIAKANDKFAELTAPACLMFGGEHKVKWTFKQIASVIGGVLLAGFTSIAVAAGIILSMAGITLLLALVLPALIANVLAIVGTLYLGYLVYQSVKRQSADEIVVDVEIETTPV